jgi:hypothetical protein
MKQLTGFFAAIFLFCASSLTAQVFIGGNLGFNSNSYVDEYGGNTNTKNTRTALNLGPTGGYFFTDKLAAGIDLSFNSYTEKTTADPETTSVSKNIGFSPFIRYYVIKLNKFAVYGKSYVGASFGTGKFTSGGTTTDSPRSTIFRFGFTPGISFDISNKIALEAAINVLNIGYYINTQKSDTNGTTYKYTSSSFTFGAGLNNIVNTNSIIIGAIFKL